jgi:hypothetical protein
MTPEEKALQAAKVAENLRNYAVTLGKTSPFGKKIGAQVWATAKQITKIAESDLKNGILDHIDASTDPAADSAAQEDADRVNPYKGEHSLSKEERAASSSYPSPMDKNESLYKYRTSAAKKAKARRRLAASAASLGDRDLANKLVIAAKKIERRYGLTKAAASNEENPGSAEDRDHIAEMVDMEMGEEYANLETFKGDQAEDGGQGSGPWGGGDPGAILNIPSGHKSSSRKRETPKKKSPPRKRASRDQLIDQAWSKAFPNA